MKVGGKVERARILLADDHKEMRDRVVRMLERDFEMLEPVNDGLALLEAALRLKPDVCLVDISMPGINGVEAATRLKECGSASKLIWALACRGMSSEEPTSSSSELLLITSPTF